MANFTQLCGNACPQPPTGEQLEASKRAVLFVADCAGERARLWVAERARTPFRTARACTRQPGSDLIWIPVRNEQESSWILFGIEQNRPRGLLKFKPERSSADGWYAPCPVHGLLCVYVACLCPLGCHGRPQGWIMYASFAPSHNDISPN